jgi:hypothetical protein
MRLRARLAMSADLLAGLAFESARDLAGGSVEIVYRFAGS